MSESSESAPESSESTPESSEATPESSELQKCHGICHGAMALVLQQLQCCNIVATIVATVATVATLLQQCYNNAMALESSETTMRTPKSTPCHGKKFSFSVKNENYVVT